MKNWRVEPTTGGKNLGIFQGDALSLLLIVIAMMSPGNILRK